MTSTEMQFSNTKITSQQSIAAGGTLSIIISKGYFSKDYTFSKFPIISTFAAASNTKTFYVGDQRFLDCIDKIQVTWDGILFENTLEPSILMKKKWDAFYQSKNERFNVPKIDQVPQLQINGGAANALTVSSFIQYPIGLLLNCLPQSQQYFVVKHEMVIEIQLKQSLNIPISELKTTGISLEKGFKSELNTLPIEIVARKYNNIDTENASYGIRQMSFQSRQKNTSSTVSFTIPNGTFSQYQLYGFVLDNVTKFSGEDAEMETLCYSKDYWDKTGFIQSFDKNGQYYIQATDLNDSVQQLKTLTKNQDVQHNTMCTYLDNILIPGTHTIQVTGSGNFSDYWYVYGYSYIVE